MTKSPKKTTPAPFTDEQVAKIEKWQESDRMHSLTCGGDNCNAALSVNNDGLSCPKCEYTQDFVPGVVVSTVANVG